MIDTFLNSLGDNFADLLVWGGAIAVAALIIFYFVKRRAHVRRLTSEVRGDIPLPSKVAETLKKVINADTAEVTAIGAVTLVDLAWHYSMADPAVWESLDGDFGDHLTDAFENMDIVDNALGDGPMELFENVFEFLKGIEATGVFNDLLDLWGVVDIDAVAVDAPADSLVDSLAASADAVDGADGGLLAHIPLVTMGFASYRAWKRAQKGAELGRNIEFAAVEVATRAGGGILGSQVGGALGSLIAPGPGTLIGGVAGSIAGAVGGAILGENIKIRHVKKAHQVLEDGLTSLGEAYLTDEAKFEKLRGVFTDQEREYMKNMRETRRTLLRYSMPWRLAWPDHKLILLRETVRTARERLEGIKLGTVEAIERLDFMREDGQYRKLGAILYSDNALTDKIGADEELLGLLREQSATLRSEMVHLGKEVPEFA